MKDIPDKSVDMILCDLPYGTTQCCWDIVIPFEPLWEQYERIIKDNGVVVLTASQPFTTDLINSNRKEFRYCWIWKKPQAVDPFMSKTRPLNDYEDYKGKVTYNPQMSIGKPYIVNRDKKTQE